MSDTDTKKMTLSSNFDEVERVEPFVRELQEWIGFSDDQYGNIMLSINEAVTNAIIHGNEQDPSKKVYVKARLEDKTLTVTVKDEGKGFDPANLPNPLDKENLLKEGGRGVYLIKQYSDEVKFSKEGTRITIQFHL